MWTVSVYFSVPTLSSDYPPLFRARFYGDLFHFYGFSSRKFLRILYDCCRCSLLCRARQGAFPPAGLLFVWLFIEYSFFNHNRAVLLNLYGAQMLKGKGCKSHRSLRANLQITLNHYKKSHTPFLGRPGRPFSQPRLACRTLLTVPI